MVEANLVTKHSNRITYRKSLRDSPHYGASLPSSIRSAFLGFQLILFTKPLATSNGADLAEGTSTYAPSIGKKNGGRDIHYGSNVMGFAGGPAIEKEGDPFPLNLSEQLDNVGSLLPQHTESKARRLSLK